MGILDFGRSVRRKDVAVRGTGWLFGRGSVEESGSWHSGCILDNPSEKHLVRWHAHYS
jgi:hypothetical protein